MDNFHAFKNDEQVVTLMSEDNEFNIENSTDKIILTGSLTLKPGDPGSKRNLLALRETLDAILKNIG